MYRIINLHFEAMLLRELTVQYTSMDRRVVDLRDKVPMEVEMEVEVQVRVQALHSFMQQSSSERAVLVWG